MKTAVVELNGERVGSIWWAPSGETILAGHTMHILGVTLKVVEVVATGVLVRKKTQDDYDYDESRKHKRVGKYK